MTFDDADGNQVEKIQPHVATSINAFDGDGHAYCTSDATNVASYLSSNPSVTYPYDCPSLSSLPTPWPPATRSDPGYSVNIYDDAGRTTSTTDQDGDTD